MERISGQRLWPFLFSVSLAYTALLLVCTDTAKAESKSAPQGSIVTIMSQSGVVAADHPAASSVGASLLAQGGTAADAAVGTLLTLGVVNPFASGLGGGGFCLYRDAKTGESQALDFREIAPAAASRDMYLVKGKVQAGLSRYGGLAVAVPSEAAGLEALHGRFGRLPWAKVVDPAWRLAKQGHYVGELLPKRLKDKADKIGKDERFVATFGGASPGQWVSAGQLLRREDLAKTLELLRDKGAHAGFYQGPVAQAIVDEVKAQGGKITLKDLEGYKPTWRAVLTGQYRGYEILAMPSPSSGGVALLQTLNILSGFELGKPDNLAQETHLIIEALRHAFADRARWLGDADFVKVPIQSLISLAYAKTLRAKIDPTKTFEPKHYGSVKPPPTDQGTTHVSIVDAQGNMAACTSTVNTSFGSLVYVGGYGLILNNEMDDFSAQPGVPNAFGLVGNAQNAIAPGKRPLSSMTPTLILKDGQPFMVAGASGGPTIITGTLMAILSVIDYKRSPTEAIVGPRLHQQWLPELVFMEPGQDEVVKALEAKGHKIKVGPAFNSVQIIVKNDKGGWTAVSDPRKNGRPATYTVH